jgi:hypothetical protein
MPQPEKFAKCACRRCGGRIEFPILGAGQEICCPHCGKPTLLFVSRIEREEAGGGRGARKRVFLVLAIAACVAAGGAYHYFGSKKLQPAAEAPILPIQTSNASPVVSAPISPPPPPKPMPLPDPWHGLKSGQVTLERTGEGRLVYAVGTLTNATARQRFGVKVVIDVLDEHRNKIGSATDYAEVIEPGKEWKFRAMVTDKTASAAKLTNVKEQE